MHMEHIKEQTVSKERKKKMEDTSRPQKVD